MNEVVGGDLEALEAYSEQVRPSREALVAAVGRYRAALAAFVAAAPNDLGGPALADLSGVLEGEAEVLARIDEVPARFAANVRAADVGGAWDAYDDFLDSPWWRVGAGGVEALLLPRRLRALRADVWHLRRLRQIGNALSDYHFTVRPFIEVHGAGHAKTRAAWQRLTARFSPEVLNRTFGADGPRGFYSRPDRALRRQVANAADARAGRVGVGRLVGGFGTLLGAVALPSDIDTVVTGSHHDGTRGTIDRWAAGASAVSTVGGGAMLLLGATTPVGWVVVGALGIGAGLWALGNLAYDYRHEIGQLALDYVDGQGQMLAAGGQGLQTAGQALAETGEVAGDVVAAGGQTAGSWVEDGAGAVAEVYDDVAGAQRELGDWVGEATADGGTVLQGLGSAAETAAGATATATETVGGAVRTGGEAAASTVAEGAEAAGEALRARTDAVGGVAESAGETVQGWGETVSDGAAALGGMLGLEGT